MDELVRRLRTATEYGEAKRRTMAEAADTITLLRADCARLRTALAALVGVDGREELEALESVIRLTAGPAQDKAAIVDAIHALLATPPDGATRDTVALLMAALEGLRDELQTMAMVAGQASVEGLDATQAQADARFANYCSGWAEKARAALREVGR